MNKGKTPYHLLDFRFLAAVAERMAEGLQTDGRAANDWKKLPATPAIIDQYFSAALRHLVAGVEQWDAQHLAAVAANAMILADLVQRADAEGAEEDGLCVGDVVKWAKAMREGLDMVKTAFSAPAAVKEETVSQEPIVYSHCVRCNAVITNTKTNVCEVCEAALQAAKRKAPARTVAELRAEIEAKHNGGQYGATD